MLEEMSKPHDETIDEVHNFLCEQDDDELFAGILREGKTIQDAMNYLVAEARKKNLFRISDAQGYRIMKEYFLGESTKVTPVGRMSTRPIDPKTQSKNDDQQAKAETIVKVEPKVEKPKKAKVEMSMSIFDFIDDPSVEASSTELDDEDIGTDE